MIQQYRSTYLEDMPKVVSELLPLFKQHRLLFLRGMLGAGKTTLVIEMARQLGYTGEINSPTFAYVNRYELPSGQMLFHFDLYRLSDAGMFQELGFDEYLSDKNALAIIEWPELIQQRYPHALKAQIDYASADSRTITVTVPHA